MFPAAVPVIQGLLGTRILLSVDKIGFLFPGFCLCITLKTIVKVYGIGSNLKVLCDDRFQISMSVT